MTPAERSDVLFYLLYSVVAKPNENPYSTFIQPLFLIRIIKGYISKKKNSQERDKIYTFESLKMVRVTGVEAKHWCFTTLHEVSES